MRQAPAADGEVRSGDADALRGIDAAIHLAGEPIAARRWTAGQMGRIHDSRTEGTAQLASTLAGLDPKPHVLLSASAVGYYGDGGDRELTESSPQGGGFLADVVADWEQAAQPAVEAGIRTVFLRTGIVLSGHGGALGKILPLYKLGLGGRIGDGHEWWPWISVDDEVGAILHLLETEVSGPVNLVSPVPVRNRDFSKALGRALHRPAVLPVPRLGPRLLLGRKLADALLGQSQRVLPRKLEASGYRFRYTDVGAALRAAVTS